VENERSKEEGQAGRDNGEKIFSTKVIHHAMEPTHMGRMDKPDGHAVITGPCGDTDEFFLRIFSDRIREIRFRTTGCFFTVAACDAVAFLAEGRTVRKGMRITKESILEYLGGMPNDHEHCALLAANTLHKAIRSYMVRGRGL
jgi:nitrogen fixation NifU-like protein